MKQLRLVVTAVLFLSSAVWAQASGTVKINGTVSKAASIRYFSSAPIGAQATVANTPAAADSVLDTLIQLGDIAPTVANNGLPQGASVSLIAHSNAPYTLTAGVVATAGFTGAVGEVAFSDFGFGVNALAASGNGNLATIAGSTVAGAFGNNGLQSGVDANGQPTYATTLANLAGAPIVVSGTRISNAGGLFNPNNGMTFATNYSVVPQYFTPTAAPFACTVTWTIATP